MIKRNKKLIKIILCSLVVTGMFQGNVSAVNISKNIETKSFSINVQESEDEKKLKLVQEYQSNKFLKDLVDAVEDYEKNGPAKNHDEKIASILEISQRIELAKKSGTLSQRGLNFIDEVIKDLEPTYSNLLSEAKNKGIKSAPMPKKDTDDIKKSMPKEKAQDTEEMKKTVPKQKKQDMQETKKKQEKAKETIEKHLPKTGDILGNNLFLQTGIVSSLLGTYFIKKKNK